MKKHIAILLAVALVLSLFAACSKPPAAPATEPTPEATPAADPVPEESTDAPETEPAGPRTVTDMTGREVEIPAVVERVAALGSAARIMTYAGAQQYVVGLSELEKNADASMPFAYANRDHFASCASVSSGGSGDEYFTEELVVLDPDLIIVFGADQAKGDELQAQLEIPVIVIAANDFLDPNFLAAIRLVGEVMGTRDHAEAVCQAVQGWIEDLNDRTKDIPEEEKPTVYTGAVGFRGPHGFEGTYGMYPPFVAINAHNVVDETEAGGAMLIDLEKVTVWDPDIIFLNPNSMYLVNEDYSTNPSFYENLTAVQEGKLYAQVSFNYFWCNMELAIADAYYAGTIIFPEQFADVDFNEKAEEIFNTMIGTDYLANLDTAGVGFGQLTIGE